MIQHGLSKHLEARKWKEVKAEVIAAEPAVSEIDSTLIGPAWKLAMSKFSKLQTSSEQASSKSPVDDSKLLMDLSKDPAQGSNDIVRESKQSVKRSREAAKTVKTYLRELLNGANSYLRIADAIANYAGAEANSVFKGATATILEMQSHCMPASLIKMKLKLVYGEQFEELVGAIWKFATSKNGQIVMQKGWKKLPLPVISGNAAEKLEQNGLKQPPFAIANAPASSPFAMASSPVVTPTASNTILTALQQLLATYQQPPTAPQNATPATPNAAAPASKWIPELRSVYRTAWDMTVQGLNSLISPEYYFSGSIPDDPAQAQSILKQVKLLFDAVNIARKISDQIPDVIAIAKRMGLEHLTAQIYG